MKRTFPEALQSFQEQFENILSKVVEFRQELHQHPELSWQEVETTRRIRRFLESFGITRFHQPTETGGWVDFVFKEGAPFVLLRGDIDALPIQDAKEVPYKSQNPGVCHACGHDVHTAVAAGVAAAVQTGGIRLPLNLRVLFQPAEEPIPAGAPKMIEAGVLKDVAFALGMHVDPRIPLGTISLTPGWVNMQSIQLDLLFEGPGGHSSRPSETADLIWLASRLIQDSYGIIYREFDWMKFPIMLTFTEIEAKEGYNIIPKKLRLTGTLRLTSTQAKNRFYMRFRNLLQELESENHIMIRFIKKEGAPPVHNNPRLIRALREIIQRETPDQFHVIDNYRSPGGDDFGFYAQQVPSALVRLGIQTRDDQPGLHTQYFDAPPEVIEVGLRFFLTVLPFLQQEVLQ